MHDLLKRLINESTSRLHEIKSTNFMIETNFVTTLLELSTICWSFSRMFQGNVTYVANLRFEAILRYHSIHFWFYRIQGNWMFIEQKYARPSLKRVQFIARYLSLKCYQILPYGCTMYIERRIWKMSCALWMLR